MTVLELIVGLLDNAIVPVSIVRFLDNAIVPVSIVGLLNNDIVPVSIVGLLVVAELLIPYHSVHEMIGFYSNIT